MISNFYIKPKKLELKSNFMFKCIIIIIHETVFVIPVKVQPY